VNDRSLELLKESHGYAVKLRREMDAWLEQSIVMDPVGSFGGGEDEANYALGWIHQYLVTRNPKIMDHFATLKQTFVDWLQRDGYHGYDPDTDIHHGTEPFILFMPRYMGLRPEDTEMAAILDDAAEHIGNWVPGIPPWYDYDRDGFFTRYLGTKNARRDPNDAVDIAETLRFIHMTLAAYRAIGTERYLEWSLRYGRKWAERLIKAEPPLPIRWGLGEKEIRPHEYLPKKNIRGLPHRGAANLKFGVHPLRGVEAMIASGGVYVFGDLYRLSGEEIFKDAARKIVEPILPRLLDPYNDPGSAAVHYFRWLFKDDSLDAQIREILAGIPAEPPSKLALVFPEEKKMIGILGYRWDMAQWGEYSEGGYVKPIQEPSTSALTLAYQMTGNIEYAARALRSASTKLAMGREVLRGGREHADMGGAICTISSGHGRNWGIGPVTGCYGPLLLGTHDLMGRVEPMLEVRDDAGQTCVPENLLPLVRSDLNAFHEVVFYNGGASPLSFSWRFTSERGVYSEDAGLASGEMRRIEIP